MPPWDVKRVLGVETCVHYSLRDIVRSFNAPWGVKRVLVEASLGSKPHRFRDAILPFHYIAWKSAHVSLKQSSMLRFETCVHYSLRDIVRSFNAPWGVKRVLVEVC